MKRLQHIVNPLFLFILLIVLFVIAPVETKAAPSKMQLDKNGNIRWETHSQNSHNGGWKLYTKNWRFTIRKTMDGKTQTKEVTAYQGENGYRVTSDEWWSGSTKYANNYYWIPVETLEKLSGWNLREGTVEYIANATMGFHKLEKDTGKVLQTDSKDYLTEEAFYKRCRELGFKSPPENHYYGYYDKVVDTPYYYITAIGDAGFESVTGSGWYEKETVVTASGTTKYGYTSNGNKSVTVTKHETVYLTSTPWSHTVTYDTKGGSPTPASFTKTYGTAAFVSNTVPSKAGYTFSHWVSSVTGTTYRPGDAYNHTQNGGTDTLVAQYTENTATFIFDANGGSGSMPSITKKWSEALTLPENGFTHSGEVTFVGWDTNSGNITASYQPEDVVNVSEIVTAAGKQYEANAEVTIYALWDALPRIDAKDRYIDLVSAQNGFLTEDELFLLASAEDTEDGIIERGEKFYIKDLDLEKYKNLTAEIVNPSISFEETYVAIDSAGNKAEKTITVTVINTAAQPSDSSSAYNYVRFISLKYLDYPPEDGGLMADSFWRIPENYNYLKSVLSIKRVNPEVRTISFLGLTYSKKVPGTGEWNAPIKQEWHFSQEDIKEVKEYVNEHGLGNSKEPDALAIFLELFADCRIQ